MKTTPGSSYLHFVIIIIAMFLLSCTTSTTNNFSYVVNNKSDKELKVYIKTGRVDSTLDISAHTQATIYDGFEKFVGDGPSYMNMFFLDVFETLRIEAVDKSTFTLNCLDVSNWKSSKTSLGMGLSKSSTTTYKIDIDNSNFK